ncbi:MAG: hypothetical protein WCE68_15115 [Anaerolineales bacterium]
MARKVLHKPDTTKILGRLLGCILAAGLFIVAAPIWMTEAAASPPAYTTSWYMDTANPASIPAAGYALGCALGTHDLKTAGAQKDVVILFFGMPAYSNATYGTYDWSSPGNPNNQVFVSSAQIAETVEQFGAGYYICTGKDRTSQLHIAAGVNNAGSDETYDQGVAWATMTMNISAWVTAQGYSSQVSVRAAGDMEPDMNSPSATQAWVDGYTSVYNSNSPASSGLYLYNVGSASGCPLAGPYTASTVCGNSWTAEGVWYVSWGTLALFPFPEIYNTVGANGTQWSLISQYGRITAESGALSFMGALTQSQACKQMGGCSGINDTPAKGWTNLWKNVKATQSSLYGSTDLKWK